MDHLKDQTTPTRSTPSKEQGQYGTQDKQLVEPWIKHRQKGNNVQPKKAQRILKKEFNNGRRLKILAKPFL